MAADPTLVQGAGMAVERSKGSTIALGIQAIQERLNEGMIKVAEEIKIQKDDFNNKVSKAIDHGQDLTPDQYGLMMDEFQKMQNEYILANPQKKALILQAVNNKITRLEQVSKGKETGKNLANLDEINGGITDAFKGTARGADVAATFTGENPMVEVDNQYGYMIYDPAKKSKIENEIEELENKDVSGLSELEKKVHSSDLANLKLSLKDPAFMKSFVNMDDYEKILNDNVVDGVFMESITNEAKSIYDASLALKWDNNEEFDVSTNSNVVYAWMQKGNKNSMLNHKLGPEVSFRDGLIDALQTTTYSENGLVFDHDNNPDTPPIKITSVFGSGVEEGVDPTPGDGIVNENDVNILRQDAETVVDKLIERDDDALWGKGGYVNTFFTNFLGQNFERAKANRAPESAQAEFQRRSYEAQLKLGEDDPSVFLTKNQYQNIYGSNDDDDIYVPPSKESSETGLTREQALGLLNSDEVTTKRKKEILVKFNSQNPDNKIVKQGILGMGSGYK